MRILHLADVHLDRSFAGLAATEARAARSRVSETFRKCLALVAEHEADAVTIGGDLWEDEHVTADTRASVAHELGSLGVPVLMICGNHDPWRPGGHYARTSWPSNVRVFSESVPEEHRFDGVSIWGVSWTGGSLDAAFLETFRAPDDGRAHLLLIHGTATVIPSIDPNEEEYCPFPPTAVAAAGFDHCLAGHIHAASAQDQLVYPGSPEPLGWGEMGGHAAALVDVSADGVAVELVPTAAHSYRQIEVDCGGCLSGAEVGDRIERELADHRDAGVHLRVALTGEIGRDCVIDRLALRERHGEGFAELVIEDGTRTAYDIDALETEQTAVGAFVRKAQAGMAEADDESARRRFELALEVGLRALDGRKDLVDVD